MANRRVTPKERTCGQCGTVFLVGGRGRPPLDQRYCSNRCAALLRYHVPTAKKLSRLDAAYLAGLVDGEGSIFIASRREQRNTWRLSISNTYRPVLAWCQETCGVGSLISSPRRNVKHKDSWWWQCYSWNAAQVVQQLLPFLIIKRDRAEQMLTEMGDIKNRRRAALKK